MNQAMQLLKFHTEASSYPLKNGVGRISYSPLDFRKCRGGNADAP